MKKKIVAMCATVALAALAVGGTLAYFTDTDGNKNTFTIGNVAIEQLERQYDANDNLVDFVQNKTMVPAVGTEKCADKTIDGHLVHYLDGNAMKNVVDKIVNVRNDSTVDIYAATLIAVEDTNDVSGQFTFVTGNTDVNKANWTALRYNGATSGNNIQIKDETTGTIYTVNLKIYDGEIAPNAYSPCALTQVYMKPTADADSVKAAGNTYDIECLSLGVQTDGFADAQTAIETGFGFDVEKLDADDAKVIAKMFGANFTAGYYSNGGFTPIV